MTEKVLKDFRQRVRLLRRKQGISQESLAHIAGLDRTYIGGIERGLRNPSLRNINKIAKALKVSIKELFE